MIGAGIFVLPGEAAGVAGPAAALSFLAGGIIALFTALSASELGTAMPKAGGSYYYVNHALGPAFGSIAGWSNWMGLAFASAFYAIGFGDYIVSWLPWADVMQLSALGFTLEPAQVGGLAAAALFIGVNYVGAKETGRLQNIIVLTLLAILAVFLSAGMFQADMTKMTPFAPNGMDAILPATALIFVSFLGFAKITTVAEEIKNPGRNLPLAVIGSVVIVTVIYVITMVILTSVAAQPLDELGKVAVVEVGRIALGSFGVVMLTFGGLLATASSANASILASSRINFAMGRDRLVSNWLNEIHDRFATPHRSIALTGVLILAFIAYGDIKVLAKAGAVLHLLVYGLLNIALIVMREAPDANYEPDFRIPFYPWVPIIGAISSFALIAYMDPVEMGLGLGFVVLGLVWYGLYARRKVDRQGVLNEQILKLSDPSTPEVLREEAPEPEPGFRVMVALAAPKSEKQLISIASALAKAKGGTVVAVHIVQVPDQTALQAGAASLERLDRSSQLLMEQAKKDAETFGVDIETHNILSHRRFDEIFDAAREQRADKVVVGWGAGSHGARGRFENALDDLTGALPCDFIVFKDRGFEPSKILLPTAGGPDSDVGAEIVHAMEAEFDAEVTLLHVVRSEDERADGEAFLSKWAAKNAFDDAEQRVAVGEDAYGEIRRQAEGQTLVVLGATERGLLERLSEGSGVAELAESLDISVILAEQARPRSLKERLFGT
jgi:amino acid transporter/nucleotide-binding universal stress UspA family protein